MALLAPPQGTASHPHFARWTFRDLGSQVVEQGAGRVCTELSTNMTMDSLMLGEHLDNLDASMMQSGEPEWDCFYLDLNGERRRRRRISPPLTVAP